MRTVNTKSRAKILDSTVPEDINDEAEKEEEKEVVVEEGTQLNSVGNNGDDGRLVVLFLVLLCLM
jgi:hypothetical protein